MIFSSIGFLIFFSIFVLLIKFFSNYQKHIIIILSLFFYSYWDPIFFLLIFYLLITTFYIIKKKISLKIAIPIILLPLFYFKYSSFIFGLISIDIFEKFSYYGSLPLAISFITFTVIALIVDITSNEFNEELTFTNFAEFIIFFPQLIAGPILRAKELIPQLRNNIIFKKDNIRFGILLFLIGFIKKVFLADNISLFIDPFFQNPELYSSKDLIKGYLLFPFQIYFDFSGYVDMALGCALMLNIILPINFNSPYKAHNVIHFWKKWHITLAEFLMNYIYYPLLRSLPNISFPLVMLVTIIVFFLAGLWHGPSWMFIAFGLIHGIGVVFNHCKEKFFNFKIYLPLSIFLTFNYVNLSFVFFRSENFDQAFIIISKMLNFSSFKILLTENVFQDLILSKNLTLLAISILIVFVFKNSDYLANSKHLK